MNKNYFTKCLNKGTLETIYPLLTKIDQLYIEGLEDKKHVKDYKIFKNCILLHYVSGGSFKQFYETKSIKNICNKYASGK